MGGADAQLPIETASLTVLRRGSGPVDQDVAPEVLEVELAFPRKAEESDPVGLVQHSDNPAAVEYELVADDLLDRVALRW